MSFVGIIAQERVICLSQSGDWIRLLLRVSNNFLSQFTPVSTVMSRPSVEQIIDFFVLVQPLLAKHLLILLQLESVCLRICECRGQVASSRLLHDWLGPCEIFGFFTLVLCASEAF